MMKAERNDAFALIMKDGMVHRYGGKSALFDDIEQAQSESDEMILALPFRQALWGNRPMSGPERLARRHVSAIRVRDYEEWTVEEFLTTGEATAVQLHDGHFDVGDDDYAQRVRTVVDNEIRTGHGSNFVLHRTFRGRISSRDVETEMAVFRSLLRSEAGAYWTLGYPLEPTWVDGIVLRQGRLARGRSRLGGCPIPRVLCGFPCGAGFAIRSR